MAKKTGIILFVVAVALVVLFIVTNYVTSEVYSTSGNPIKRIYFKNTFVKAETVNTKEKIELGLAGRKELPEDRGMLFIMPSDDFQRFWMRGMQFPIDIIWIEKNQTIGCEKNISPKDERIFASPGEAGLVLEVPAGFCDKYNVQVNDDVSVR